MGKTTFGILTATLLLASTAGADSLRGANTTQALTDIANGKRACKDLHVSFKEGDGVHGWLEVTVANDRIIVRRSAVGQPDSWFLGRLDPEDCRDLAAAGADRGFPGVRRKRSFGRFDETRPRITIGAIRAGSLTAEQWADDAGTNAAFDSARRRLLTLAVRVSDGGISRGNVGLATR